MSKPLRICQPNLTYHVYSRCIECRELLADYFKEILLSVLKRTQDKYDFELVHYTFMNNHIHMIIKTVENGASISRIMQYVKSRLAEIYNKANGRTGPFWNERFKDVIVEYQDNPVRYFFWLMWYIGFNPVRKGYVKCPEQYRYGSINYYTNEHFDLPVRITLHAYFLNLGTSFSERVRIFRQWEDAYKNHFSHPYNSS